MKKHLKPLKEESPKQTFNLNLEIINRQINQVREKFSFAIQDGNISQTELDQIIVELRIAEKLLVCFLDKDFSENMEKSLEAFNKKYIEIRTLDLPKQKSAIQSLYKEHILFYLGELMRVSTRATFLSMSQNG